MEDLAVFIAEYLGQVDCRQGAFFPEYHIIDRADDSRRMVGRDGIGVGEGRLFLKVIKDMERGKVGTGFRPEGVNLNFLGEPLHLEE